MYNYLRFRYRRQVRRVKREAKIVRKWSVDYINRHIWGKWHQVQVVRRFMLIWWLVLTISFVGMWQQLATLHSLASVSVPVAGGAYTEAAVGSVRGLNPILPESTISSDVNTLIFNGLTRYNSRRQLIPDLATGWTISNDGKTYTFTLRHGVKWHDGVPFTATDVAFTLAAIQNPDSRSPLASSWQGVKVETKGDDTVIISLPQPLNSFLDSTTVGIVPRHVLESVEPSLLRESTFNQHPIGTGPFEIKTFAPSAKEIELSANPNYYGGKPLLDQFNFKFYDTQAEAVEAYAQRQVTSPGRITPDMLTEVDRQTKLTQYQFSLPEEEVLFYALDDPIMSNKSLRTTLSSALDRNKIIDAANDGRGLVITQPILPGQIGYSNKYAAASLSIPAANAALDQAGWIKSGMSTIRQKDGVTLQLKMVTLKGGDLERAADEIKRQWAGIGVSLDIKAVDKDELQQTYMRPRNFQTLLYGINLGSDPDVYSFWHSSQAKDPGVNLSGYNSGDADKALETARIKNDEQIRIGKYDTFLKAWNEDQPAAVLYEVTYSYGTSSDVSGIAAHRLAMPSDRFYGVERWTVHRRLVPAR